MRPLTVFLGLMSVNISLAAQIVSDDELAHLLAAQATKGKALEQVAASGNSRLSLLLSWTEHPPHGVDQYQLKIGLADAFGMLKADASIPFLMDNISLEQWPMPDIWLKTPEVIQEHFPAVRALVRIGAEASRSLVNTDWVRYSGRDRLAAIFTISQIKDPGAVAFLSSVAGEAKLETSLAEDGLNALHVLPASLIRGRFVGCEFAQDWWVRAMPMFNSTTGAITSHVQRDGTFSVSGIMVQARYLIIVGKGSEPVKVIARDINLEHPNDIGTISLKGTCSPD